MRPTQAEADGLNGFHSGSPLHVTQRTGTRITLAASVLPKDRFKEQKPEPKPHLGTAQPQLFETNTSRSAWKRAEVDLVCEGFAGMQDWKLVAQFFSPNWDGDSGLPRDL